MQVHQDGDGLAQQDAGPHYHVANLPSGEGHCCEDAQGDLSAQTEKSISIPTPILPAVASVLT